MTSVATAKKPNPNASEQVTNSPEALRSKQTKLQFAAVFNSCVQKVRGGDGISVSEYTLTRRGSPAQTGYDLGEIYAKTLPNKANIITVNPRAEGQNVKHIFYLNQVSGDQALSTFFEVEHDGVSLQSAKLWQEIDDGGDVIEKRMSVDAEGNFKDIHKDASHRARALTDPALCIPDLMVVSETVAESVEDAVRHATMEFERVEHPDGPEESPNEVPEGLFRAALFGAKHRGEGLKIAA